MIDNYNYITIWSSDDSQYVGLCVEFPSLSWLSDTHEDASTGIKQLVFDCVNDMQATNESVPNPLNLCTLDHYTL